MAKGAYIGVGSKAKKIKKIYIGIGSVAKKVKKAYIGVGGVAKLFFISSPKIVKSSSANVANGYTGSSPSYLHYSGTTFADNAVFGVHYKIGTRYNASLTRNTFSYDTTVMNTYGFSHTTNHAVGRTRTAIDTSFTLTRDHTAARGSSRTDTWCDMQTANYAFLVGETYDSDDEETTYYVDAYNDSLTRTDVMTYTSSYGTQGDFSGVVESFNGCICELGTVDLSASQSPTGVRGNFYRISTINDSLTISNYVSSSSPSWKYPVRASAHVEDYAVYQTYIDDSDNNEGALQFVSCSKSFTISLFYITDKLASYYDCANSVGGNLPNACIFGGGWYYTHNSGSSYWWPKSKADTWAFDEWLTKIDCDYFATPRHYHGRGSIGSYLIFAGGENSYAYDGSTTDTQLFTTEVYKQE